MKVKTIAFDYYDGLTEGLSLLNTGNEFYYFKLLAWDGDQNKRLYFLSEIQKSDFDYILTVLSQGQQIPQADIWLVQWGLPNKHDEDIVTSKIEKFWKNNYSYIALGYGICDESLKRFEIEENLTDKVSRALKSDNIDDLSNWLLFLQK